MTNYSVKGTIKENILCKLKGHMWYVTKRRDVRKEDDLYSVAVEEMCARCGKRRGVLND